MLLPSKYFLDYLVYVNAHQAALLVRYVSEGPTNAERLQSLQKRQPAACIPFLSPYCQRLHQKGVRMLTRTALAAVIPTLIEGLLGARQDLQFS